MDEFISRTSTEIRNVAPGMGGDLTRAVRAFPAAPDWIHLQVRAVRGKTPIYAGASLSREETRRLRDYLSVVLREHFGE